MVNFSNIFFSGKFPCTIRFSPSVICPDTILFSHLNIFNESILAARVDLSFMLEQQGETH